MNPILFNIMPASPSPDVKPATGKDFAGLTGSSSKDGWQEAFLVAAVNTGPAGSEQDSDPVNLPVVELSQEQESEGKSDLLDLIFKQVPTLSDHPVGIKIVDPQLLAMLEGRLEQNLIPDGQVLPPAPRPEQISPEMIVKQTLQTPLAGRPVPQSIPVLQTDTAVPELRAIPDHPATPTMQAVRPEAASNTLPDMKPIPANQAEPAGRALPDMKPMPAMQAEPAARALPDMKPMPAMQTETAARALPDVKPIPAMQTETAARTLPDMKSGQHAQPVQRVPTMQTVQTVQTGLPVSEKPVMEPVDPAPILRKAPTVPSTILQVAREQLQTDMKQSGVPSSALEAAQSNAQAILTRVQKSIAPHKPASSLRQAMATPEGKTGENSRLPNVHEAHVTKSEQIRQFQSQETFPSAESATNVRNGYRGSDSRQAATGVLSGMRTVSAQPIVVPEAAMSLSHTAATSGPTGTGLPQVVHYTNLAEAIMARAQALPSNGQVHVRFSLEPEDLGMVKIQIRTRGDSVRIEIAAASGQAAETLQHGVARLTSQLEAAGYKNPDIQLSLDNAHDPTDPNRNTFSNHERNAARNGNQGTDGNRTGQEHRTETLESSGTGQATSRRGGLNLMA